MGLFSAVQSVAEQSSDTIPEVKQFVMQLQTVSSQVSDTIPEVKETINLLPSASGKFCQLQ